MHFRLFIFVVLCAQASLHAAADDDGKHVVRFPMPDNVALDIDIKQEHDPISLESLSDCLKERTGQSMPFIIARACIAAGNGHAEYHNAHALHRFLFHAGLPHRYQEGAMAACKSPLTNLPYVGPIEYAYWDDAEQIVGTYLGSDHDMHCNPDKKRSMHQFFLRTYPLLDQEGSNAVMQVMQDENHTTDEAIASGHYTLAQQLKRLDPDHWQDVHHTLKYVAQQNADINKRHQSRVEIAAMFLTGKGMEQASAHRAYMLFDGVARQTEAPIACANAQCYLGQMWEDGWRNGEEFNQDTLRAQVYYQNALKEQRLAEHLRASAFYRLGKMYEYGTRYLKEDHAKALQHYEAAAWQDADKQISLQAHFTAGLMYAHTLRNFKMAGEHFNIVANQNDHRILKRNAQEQLDVLQAFQRMRGARVFAPYVPEASSSDDAELSHRDKRQRR